MAVIIPTGWEQFPGAMTSMGNSILNAVMKKQELEARAKEKDPLEIMGKFIELEMQRSGGSFAEPTPEEVRGASSTADIGMGISKPTVGSLTGIPPTELSMMYGSKMGQFLGQTPENKIQQDLSKRVIEKQVDLEAQKAGIPVKVEEQKALAPIKGLEKKYGLNAEYINKISQAKSTSGYNYALVAGNMKDLSSRLVDAYKEGGAGDVIKSSLSNLYREGWIPGKLADITGMKYPKTAAVFGKRFEIVGKMFPQITQQLDKAGSVRLIESIFNLIDKTIPNTNNPAESAPYMMDATIESLFRIQKAFENINLKEYDLDTQEKANSFVEKMWETKNSIELTPEEREVLTATQMEASEPIRNYLGSTSQKIDDILRKRNSE